MHGCLPTYTAHCLPCLRYRAHCCRAAACLRTCLHCLRTRTARLSHCPLTCTPPCCRAPHLPARTPACALLPSTPRLLSPACALYCPQRIVVRFRRFWQRFLAAWCRHRDDLRLRGRSHGILTALCTAVLKRRDSFYTRDSSTFTHTPGHLPTPETTFWPHALHIWLIFPHSVRDNQV